MRNAKASSAGSSTRQATRLGRIVRGAAAFRAASREAKGSNAPSHRRLASLLAAAALFVALGTLTAAPASAALSHNFLFSFDGSATPAGSFSASGVSVDNYPASPSYGKVYVSSSTNTPTRSRVIDRFIPSTSSAAFDCQITGAGSAATDLTNECDSLDPGFGGFVSTAVSGTAVDPSTGNLYVPDATGRVVDVFDSSGKYLTQITGFVAGTPRSVAIDASTGLVYIVDFAFENMQVDTYDPSTSTLTIGWETGLGQLQVGGLAVDNDPTSPAYRDVYVSDSANQVVDVFSPTGGPPLTQITSGLGGAHAFVSNFPRGLAVDPANGHLYVSADETAPGFVDEFVPAAGPTFAFAASLEGSATTEGSMAPGTLAVSKASGDVYVSDTTARTQKVIDIFGPDIITPDVTTGAASNVAPTTATLNGTVNPEGVPLTDCHFEFVPQSQYEVDQYTSVTPAEKANCATDNGNPISGPGDIPADLNVHAVTADVTSLTADTTYHFRLVASNANATIQGLDQSFTTTGPPTVDGQSTANIAKTTATLQAQVNPHGFATTYHFQYIDEASFQGDGQSFGAGTETTPQPDADIGSQTSDQAVSQDIAGLTPATTYHYRVVATNSAGPPVQGPDRTFTTRPPVLIYATGASNVTVTTATLRVYLNPLGDDTHYRFQYGTEEGSYPHSTPEADAGAGTSFALEEAPIEGLAPATTYHFRVVATNALTPAGGIAGPDLAFTTPPASCPNETRRREDESLNLPECRAYEMVSPVEKGGYGVSDAIGVNAPQFASAPSGDGFAFSSVGVFAGAPSDPGFAVYYASRGAHGWSTSPLSPPATIGPASETTGDPQDYSSSLGAALSLVGFGRNWGQAAAAGEKAFFVHTPGSPDTPEGFVQASPLLRGAGGESARPTYEGASSDLSHVIVESGTALEGAVPGGVDSAGEIYEAEGTGTLRLIGVDSNNKPLDQCRVELGTQDERFHAISRDGSEVFFTVCGHLYVRVNGAETIQISGSGSFQGASEDGSKVFYASGGDLYMATIGCAGGATGEACGSAAREVTSLAQVSNNPHGGAGGLVGVVRISGDGSHTYFVAGGVLTDGKNAEGEEPAQGADNLYVYDANTQGLKFVADLCSGPVASGAVPDPRCGSTLSTQQGFYVQMQGNVTGEERHRPVNDSMLWEATDLRREAQVNECGTPHSGECTGDREPGRFLVFSSYAQLTPDDTDQALDVYRYDAGTGTLERVSAGENGHDENGNEERDAKHILNEQPGFPGTGEFAASATISAPAFKVATVAAQHEMHARAISEDGSTIVFSTGSPLSPRATNGQVDIYAWHQPAGAGAQVGLISSGSSSSVDMLPIVTPLGRDVFFITQAGLVPQDTDGQLDVYDARIGGGFPVAPAAPAGCAGEACRGALTAAPGPLAAGSLTQPPESKSKRLTRAQKLASALKACRKRPKSRRAACEARARRKYGGRAATRSQVKQSSGRVK